MKREFLKSMICTAALDIVLALKWGDVAQASEGWDNLSFAVNEGFVRSLWTDGDVDGISGIVAALERAEDTFNAE